MPTVNCSPFGPKPQFELTDGTPAVGYKLFTYVAGSVNTKQSTYTDSTGASANTNPIVLNSLGNPPNEIWLQAGLAYKFVLAPSTDTDPPTSPVWSIDNLRGINDTTVSASEWVAGPTATYVSGTSFTLSGDQTSIFTVNRRVQVVDAGGTKYGTISSSTYAAGLTTVVVTQDGSNYANPIASVSYGLLGSTNVSVPAQYLTAVRAYLAGLTMSTAGGSATMSIAAGSCVDSTNTAMMTLAAISKTTSAWAVGTGNGGIDTGVIANNTWYHFYVIKRPDTQVTDVIFSTSASAPTLPANYTVYRRIGSGLTNGSAQWTKFVQYGDAFYWDSYGASFTTAVNPGTAAVTRTLANIPTGISVDALIMASVAQTDAAGANFSLWSDLAISDQVPANGFSDTPEAITLAGGITYSTARLTVRTNTSAQIRTRVSFSNGNTAVSAFTMGWIDRRGRDS